MFKPISEDEYWAMDWPGRYAYNKKMKNDWAKRNGLRSANGALCVKRLAKSKHRYSDETCAGCDILSRSSVIDHPYMFRSKTYNPCGLECIVVHPYNMGEEEIRELENICSQYGLEYEVRPKSESWYNWHGTYMVIIRRNRDLYPDESI